MVSTQLDRAGWGDYDNIKVIQGDPEAEVKGLFDEEIDLKCLKRFGNKITTTGVVILTDEPEEKV